MNRRLLSTFCRRSAAVTWLFPCPTEIVPHCNIFSHQCDPVFLKFYRCDFNTLLFFFNSQEISSEQKNEILSILSKGLFTTAGAQDEEINSGNEVRFCPSKLHSLFSH